jgi:hypothetical protein
MAAPASGWAGFGQAPLSAATTFCFPPASGKIIVDFMNTTTTDARAPADISRANGAMSRGPVTAAGKVTSAANAVVHGLATRAALLPDEDLEQYRANLTAWNATLGARSPGEAQVVGRVADIAFKRDRLARLEEKLTVANVEKALAASGPAKALTKTKEALQGVEGLLALAEGVSCAVDADQVAKLVPAMRVISNLVDEADVPVGPAAKLDAAIDRLVTETAATVEPTAFSSLAAAVREVQDVLRAMVATGQLALEAERERLAEAVALAEDAELAVLERHRGRLARALEGELRALKLLRELARPEPQDPGSLVQPILLEVRVLGRRRVA